MFRPIPASCPVVTGSLLKLLSSTLRRSRWSVDSGPPACAFLARVCHPACATHAPTMLWKEEDGLGRVWKARHALRGKIFRKRLHDGCRLWTLYPPSTTQKHFIFSYPQRPYAHLTRNVSSLTSKETLYHLSSLTSLTSNEMLYPLSATAKHFLAFVTYIVSEPEAK